MLLESLMEKLIFIGIYAIFAILVIYTKLRSIHKKNILSGTKSEEFKIFKFILILAGSIAFVIDQTGSKNIKTDNTTTEAMVTFLIFLSPFLIVFFGYFFLELYRLYKLKKTNSKDVSERSNFSKKFSYMNLVFLSVFIIYCFLSEKNYENSDYVNKYIENSNRTLNEAIQGRPDDNNEVKLSKVQIGKDRIDLTMQEINLTYGVDDIDEEALLDIKKRSEEFMDVFAKQLSSDKEMKEVLYLLSKDKPLEYVLSYTDKNGKIIFSTNKSISFGKE